jgi:hypothetical protein
MYGMNVVGDFIKRLAWRERDFLPAFHLHHKPSLPARKEKHAR